MVASLKAMSSSNRMDVGSSSGVSTYISWLAFCVSVPSAIMGRRALSTPGVSELTAHFDIANNQAQLKSQGWSIVKFPQIAARKDKA